MGFIMLKDVSEELESLLIMKGSGEGMGHVRCGMHAHRSQNFLKVPVVEASG